MQAILADADVPETVRVAVIEVLLVLDAKGNQVGEAFDLLLKEVARSTSPAKLRQRMIISLRGLLPKPSEQASLTRVLAHELPI